MSIYYEEGTKQRSCFIVKAKTSYVCQCFKYMKFISYSVFLSHLGDCVKLVICQLDYFVTTRRMNLALTYIGLNAIAN